MFNKKINLVFPCAGKGERFGNVFKPFLKIGDLTFIEKAFEPFEKWIDYIDKVFFLVTYEQEKEFQVYEKLIKMIDMNKVRVLFLKKQTTGPLQTFAMTYLRFAEKSNPFIVCDCDHSIDVDEMFTKIINNDLSDVIIPVWNIKFNEQQNWSKILFKDGNIHDFANKEIIDFNLFDVAGIIGCIYFKNCYEFTNITNEKTEFYQIIKQVFDNGKSIALSRPKRAYFFGDVEMLEDCIEKRRGECTIFCDIDGVLLKHRAHSNQDPDNELLKGFEKLKQLSEDNHKIVLTTARSKKFRKELINLLKFKNVYYDELIMGLPSGPRFLINDRKPSKLFTRQANAFEVERNSGIELFEISNVAKDNKVKVLKDLSANSFAKTYLLSIGDKKIIRKRVSKSNKKALLSLKRQKLDLQRFNFLAKGICPTVINEIDNDFEFYFDMEFLSGYKMLSKATVKEQNALLNKLLALLDDKVYSMSTKTDGKQWVDDFLNVKIYPKLKNFSLIDDDFNSIIKNKTVTINNKTYYGLNKIINLISLKDIVPDHKCVVHGDLTLENILFKDDDIKVIDMDGSRIFDARELDLGKLSQSILSNYDKWKNIERIVYQSDGGDFKCDDRFFHFKADNRVKNLFSSWSKILGDDLETIKKKSIFYMSMYFIRFVPFRMQISKEHGLFALLMAVVWLNKIFKGENNEN